MRLRIWGVIAITSALTFACTTTTTETTTASGTSEPAAEKEWQPKLSLSKPGNSAAMAALGKKAGAKPATRWSGGGGKCGLSSGDATCDTCLDTSCCSQNQACVNDADCSALIACGNACTDDTCFANCFSAHPSGAKILDTLMTCVETSCVSACGGPPPSSSACGFETGDPSCTACLDAGCCGDANACLNEPDCIALLDCASVCNDNACIASCEAKHPTGASKMNALSSCANTKCGSTCNGGGGGGGGSPPPAGSCGLTSGVATCDACLDASCCGQTTSCITDSDCVAIVNCYNGCSDATCAAACDSAHPTGLTKLNAVLSCAQGSCGTTCGL